MFVSRYIVAKQKLAFLKRAKILFKQAFLLGLDPRLHLAVGIVCTELMVSTTGSDAPVALNQPDQLRWIRASAVSPGVEYTLNLASQS